MLCLYVVPIANHNSVLTFPTNNRTRTLLAQPSYMLSVAVRRSYFTTGGLLPEVFHELFRHRPNRLVTSRPSIAAHLLCTHLLLCMRVCVSRSGVTTAPAGAPRGSGGGPCANPPFFHNIFCRLCIVVLMDAAQFTSNCSIAGRGGVV